MQLAQTLHDRPIVRRGEKMFRTRFVFGVSVLMLGSGIVVFAQAHGNGPKSTHPTTAPKSAAPAPHTATKPASPVKPAKAPQPAASKHTAPSTTAGKAPAPKTSPAKTASMTQTKTSPAKTDKT